MNRIIISVAVINSSDIKTFSILSMNHMAPSYALLYRNPETEYFMSNHHYHHRVVQQHLVSFRLLNMTG